MPFECGALEGRALMGSLCLDRCACFHENATNFSMPKLCSDMEGRELPVSLCIDRCSRLYEHSTYFIMPLLCSEMEGRALLAIPNMYIRSARD
jgi:hypothetical protein